MLKKIGKIGLPVAALAGLLAFAAPQAKAAHIHFGIGIGAPVYTAPVAPYYPYDYGYGYSPYVDPYYAPTYVAPAPYVAPYFSLGWGGGWHGHEHFEHHGGEHHEFRGGHEGHGGHRR